MNELGRLSASENKTAAKYPVVVVLDNVRSMHNVGSVFRSADAFAIEKIFLCGFTPQPPHRDIHKTALGATDTVAWQYYSQTLDAVLLLKAQGYTIVAVEQTNQSTLLPQFHWDGQQSLAIIFGNEVTGVSDEVLALCELAIEIPQWGTKHSINISVAAGIVMYTLAAASGK